MSVELIKIDATPVAKIIGIEALNDHLNSVLKRHDGTKAITLEYSETEANSLSQLMKRNWKTRGVDDDSAKSKALRTNEMRALRAVFIAEDLNRLIEAWFHYNGYQPRFEGTSKVSAKGTSGGIGTMKFVPPNSQGDKVGVEARELASSVKAGRTVEALKALLGDKAHRIVDLQNGDITVDQLVSEVKE